LWQYNRNSNMLFVLAVCFFFQWTVTFSLVRRSLEKKLDFNLLLRYTCHHFCRNDSGIILSSGFLWIRIHYIFKVVRTSHKSYRSYWIGGSLDRKLSCQKSMQIGISKSLNFRRNVIVTLICQTEIVATWKFLSNKPLCIFPES